jgi:FAD/FMN-containing dehydrogenase
VGVAGWLLGGGYSLKSNQYCLGIDNVTEYEVVVPNGEIRIATEETFPELFQALRVRSPELYH